jgi:hypothetical protein
MRHPFTITLLGLLCATAACGSNGGGTADDAGGDDVEDPIDAPATPIDAPEQVNFSFFVTSLDTMRLQSGSQDGFGGDLGGLEGADAICQTAATNVGFGHKTWRAFLSVTSGPNGTPVNAIDRIGDGPWYDRNGRLIAMNKAGLLQTRPAGDAQAVNDLVDENGVPGTALGDTHDIMTASTAQGILASTNLNATCMDWTSASDTCCNETVQLGHSWPAMSGQSWVVAHRMRGCAPGVNLIQNGPGEGNCVGCGGGWGGIYCFALEP